jgi:hypothetical protein
MMASPSEKLYEFVLSHADDYANRREHAYHYLAVDFGAIRKQTRTPDRNMFHPGPVEEEFLSHVITSQEDGQELDRTELGRISTGSLVASVRLTNS